MNRYFKVDGVLIPQPNSGFSVQLEDISSSDSGRNLSGLMDKKVITQKWTVELNYSMLSDETISKLLTQIKGKTTVQLTFPSPLKGSDDTLEFYTGTPSITHKLTTNNDICFWDLKISFIEV
jgi:hypothetical protein